MSLETRNLVTEEEFGLELAGARIGWSAILPYGSARPDKIFSVHVATATIGEDGASLRYEERDEDEGVRRAYWSDAAQGFTALAGVSVIIDTEENLDAAPRIGPYWALGDGKIRGSSDGRILRSAGDAHHEEALETSRVWARSPQDIVANVKRGMEDIGMPDHYPKWYHTINTVLGHEGIRGGTPLGRLPVEATLLPDADMCEYTAKEMEAASSIVDGLTKLEGIDATMLRNLTAFGDIPAEEIPAAFKASREEVGTAEKDIWTAYKQLNTRAGVYLPVGIARTWPYMSADITPTDERSFGAELVRLERGEPDLAQSELERERSELEYRKNYAAQGLAALELLQQLEAQP